MCFLKILLEHNEFEVLIQEEKRKVKYVLKILDIKTVNYPVLNR